MAVRWVGKAIAQHTRISALAFTLALAACSGGGGGDGSASGGSGSAPPPPPSQSLIADEAEAVRFLQRATFGPSMSDAQRLAGTDASAWFRAEISKPVTRSLPGLLVQTGSGGTLNREAANYAAWENMLLANDQLRMRMVFALSQIIVVSDNGSMRGSPLTMAHYHDILSENAFGNYRDLLEDVTYSPAMARYLTYLRNRKGDERRGRMPDENYAREIMQLFTIGLVELNNDGTRRLDGAGNEIETYDNDDVTGLSRVFTGLDYKGASRFGRNDFDDDATYSPLVANPDQHSPLEKVFLGTVIAAGTDAETSIDMALDTLFEHPNVGPFIGRQLIQRFTVSDPSPAYVNRVATAFNEGRFELPNRTSVGTGRRGDLSATLAAILFDPEVIDLDDPANSVGKVREPVIRFANYVRAFDTRNINPSNENWLRDTSSTERLSQHPFRSPSVFNFYRPGYVAPNTATGDASLTAPELQIVNASASAGYLDFMTRFVRDDSPRSNRDVVSFTPDYSDERAMAGDPAALVAHLDLLLTGNRLDPVAREQIVEAIGAIPISDNVDKPEDIERDELRRVHLAILMMVASPQYMTQP